MSRTFLQKLLYGGGVFFDLTKWLILVVVALIIVNKFWFTIFIVDGESMEPNFHDRELVLLNKNYLRGSALPARGDAVVVQYPGDPEHKRYVKRVIALPGESIEVGYDLVAVNGKRLTESYIPYGTNMEPEGNWQLRSDQYFLMGDNRENSNDSRYFGPVERRFFIGRAAAIIYPRFLAIEKPLYNPASAFLVNNPQ
ncbi:signal peptidase I [Candidatus Berkelbacteria bacterium RIFOXYA2_FULL_43_10]|uniref:Signal peptidase I n=1 Tax=Candidatus Berkelbacteria bacterium RIFOXYA2_FULL_43_10 TaxID=1797472 RepID=A0A1F5E9M0_9BACT|nr:MAG: signal peptidase I [Candidatus Berkelbacteria bacterium RIFOXYA2_FULL_43_10]